MPKLRHRRRSVIAALLAGGLIQVEETGIAQPSHEYSALLSRLESGEIRAYGAGQAVKDRPGSILKLLTAATALEHQITNSSRRIYCPGWLDPPEHMGLGRLSCWDHRGHGSLSLVEAIGLSCNVHFYRLGLELGLGRLMKGLERFGLQEKAVGSAPWVATGEDPELRVSLRQVLEWVSVVARRGQGQSSLQVGADVWDLLHAGMIRAAQAGTAQGIEPPGVSVAAKTGTVWRGNLVDASVVDGDPSSFRSWVVAFWPVASPTWAMALYLHQGRAYEEAIPIARALIARHPA